MKPYPTSGIYPRLFPEELAAALNLWRAGKNTYQIARDLRGTKHAEPAVANSLADERKRRFDEVEQAVERANAIASKYGFRFVRGDA
jgi:hypothetical protein